MEDSRLYRRSFQRTPVPTKRRKTAQKEARKRNESPNGCRKTEIDGKGCQLNTRFKLLHIGYGVKHHSVDGF